MDLKSFSHLRRIDLTGNDLTELKGELLPSSLESLELGYNRLKRTTFRNLRFPNLTTMNTGYNSLTSESSFIKHIFLAFASARIRCRFAALDTSDFSYRVFSKLRHLDLSYNKLASLERTVDVLKYLARLKALLLLGNPCSVREAPVLYAPHLGSY